MFKILFLKTLRRQLMFLVGYKVGKNTSVQAVRFFSFGHLEIGNNTIINSGCYIDNRRGIQIGHNVVIAHDTKIYTLGHDVEDSTFITKGSPVHIEDYVVIFSNVLIMPGVLIQKGAVILPGTVVTKNVGPMEIVGGNPARIIKMRKALHLNKIVTDYWFSI